MCSECPSTASVGGGAVKLPPANLPNDSGARVAVRAVVSDLYKAVQQLVAMASNRPDRLGQWTEALNVSDLSELVPDVGGTGDCMASGSNNSHSSHLRPGNSCAETHQAGSTPMVLVNTTTPKHR